MPNRITFKDAEQNSELIIHGVGENAGRKSAEALTFFASTPDSTVILHVPPEELAVKLGLIPGFTVKYDKPVVVPTYLGAVVEREVYTDKGTRKDRWVRYRYDSELSLPWIGPSGGAVSNDEIAGVLANGGYEREPEAPRR